jgi:hypothetical protein
MPISALCDDNLLEIFKFYVDEIYNEASLHQSSPWHQTHHVDAWHTLMHVCRKWRYVVFASPRWLHLELICTERNSVYQMPNVWLALPIVIYVSGNPRCEWSNHSGVTNVISVLKRYSLVCRINIWGVPNSVLDSTAMKKRFPELTDLALHSNENDAPVITDSFLGGSAPRLRSLQFTGISFPFPALGKLLLSATDLVILHLLDIPDSGYISPELVITSLSTLIRLQYLSIHFRSPRPYANRELRYLSASERLVLLSLTKFDFKGDSEYLEDFVGRIDAPALDRVAMAVFNQLVFDPSLLHDFFTRTEVLQEPNRAVISVSETHIKLTLSRYEEATDRRMLEVWISSTVAESQLSSLAQFCSTCLPPLLMLEYLDMDGDSSLWEGPTDMDSAPWLELLHSFVTVEDLALSKFLVQYVAPALRELTGAGFPEVLPALRHIFIDWPDPVGPALEAIAQSVTVRQLSGYPVALNPMNT